LFGAGGIDTILFASATHQPFGEWHVLEEVSDSGVSSPVERRSL
jgi:hypothetical protein